jgi:hypothetical protein
MCETILQGFTQYYRAADDDEPAVIRVLEGTHSVFKSLTVPSNISHNSFKI